MPFQLAPSQDQAQDQAQDHGNKSVWEIHWPLFLGVLVFIAVSIVVVIICCLLLKVCKKRRFKQVMTRPGWTLNCLTFDQGDLVGCAIIRIKYYYYYTIILLLLLLLILLVLLLLQLLLLLLIIIIIIVITMLFSDILFNVALGTPIITIYNFYLW